MKALSTLCTISMLLAFSSCTPPVPDEDTALEHNVEQALHSIPEGDLEILLIEGCEYIVYKEGQGSNHGFGYMSHKGNCKNPIHIYRSIADTNAATDSRDTIQATEINRED